MNGHARFAAGSQNLGNFRITFLRRACRARLSEIHRIDQLHAIEADFLAQLEFFQDGLRAALDHAPLAGLEDPPAVARCFVLLITHLNAQRLSWGPAAVSMMIDTCELLAVLC